MMEPILLILAVALLIIIYRWTKQRQLPPGPWNMPFFGYLLCIDKLAPYLTLSKLAEKYGPIYGLYLGNVYTVVISDAELVRKTFIKDVAAGRADLYLTHGIMKGYGLICAQGPLWKDQRKFIYSSLKAFGGTKVAPNKKHMENLIVHYVEDFIQHVKSQGNVVQLDPWEALRHSLGSIFNSIVFGKTWPRDDKTWMWLQHQQEEGTKYIGVAGVLNFLPILRFLPSSKAAMSFLIEGKLKTHEIYKEIIHDEIKKMTVSEDEPTNLIQAFLKERLRRKGSEDVDNFYNDEQFYHLLADIYGAGVDTTLTTLRWYLLYIAIYKEEQMKVREEILALGPHCLTSGETITALPYMEASIAEVQRIRSVVPTGIPHAALDDMLVDGFSIPKGTMIMPLQWAIHMNPRFWKCPQQFDPSRFLNDEEKFVKPEQFIPFQTGKRMCVGDDLARTILHLFVAGIVQNFDIGCENVDKVDLTGDCGITLTPKPQRLIFTRL